MVEENEKFNINLSNSQVMCSGFTVLHFSSVTSTQDIAKMIGKENIVIVADEQREGRGRTGNRWFSPLGGIWFTVTLKTDCKLLTLAAGVAAVKALKIQKVDVKLKWPNDLIYKGKKLGGIIAEKSGELVYLGVGINVGNDIPDEIKKIAVAVGGIQREWFIDSFTNELCTLISLESKEIVKLWRRYDITVGHHVCVNNGKETCGIAESVSEDGALVINRDGNRVLIYSGHVRFI